MKIALLHFEYRSNKIENNVKKIIEGIRIAKSHGADWVLTPEMAVQGYFFYENGEGVLEDKKPLLDLVPILSCVIRNKIRLFVGALEKSGIDKFYNSCYLINKDGYIEDTQRKATGHNVGAEQWSVKGSEIKAFTIDGFSVKILICSDSWYADKQAESANTDLVLVPGCWPNVDVGGGLPTEAWNKCSLQSKGLVIAANQTGNKERMDMTSCLSAVIKDGEILFQHAGSEAVILLEIAKEKDKTVFQKALLVALTE